MSPAPDEHRAPKDRGEDDGERVGSGQQRDGDRVEADADEHPWAEEAAGAGDLAGTGQAGEGAGERHHDDDRAVDADAGVLGGVRVGADRADLEAERRAPEDEPHDDAQRDGQEEPEVDAAGSVPMTSGSRADVRERLGAGDRRGGVAQDDRVLRVHQPAHDRAPRCC